MNKLKSQIKAFWDSSLDDEELWYENHSDEFEPVDKQSEMRKKMIEAANRPTGIHYSERKPKKPVTIRIDDDEVDVSEARKILSL